MKQNVVRSLIFDDEVSLTIIDGTEIAKEGAKLHCLSGGSKKLFSTCLLFATFLGASLKEERGEISLSIKGDGEVKDICVSGNFALKIRGSIDEANASERENLAEVCFQNDGSITVIRNDGYTRPFVGACQALYTGMDENFEEYFRISEQLPTFFKTEVALTEEGEIAFAGLIALQPLPFATGETLEKCADRERQAAALTIARLDGVTAAALSYGAPTERVQERFAEYKCNCSKSYLSAVLASVGKTELKKIVEEDGAVRVHCHYCNKDYAFFDADIEEIFKE